MIHCLKSILLTNVEVQNRVQSDAIRYAIFIYNYSVYAMVTRVTYLHAPDLRRLMTQKAIEANPVLPLSILHRYRFLPSSE